MIDKSMQTALSEHTGDATFIYPVSLGLKITPYSQSSARVVAKIGYSVKHSDETDGRIVDSAQQSFTFTDGGKEKDGTRIINCEAKKGGLHGSIK